MEDYVSIPTAAALLRQSYHKTYSDVLQGRLVGSQVGGRWYVERGSVREVLRNSQDKAVASA